LPTGGRNPKISPAATSKLTPRTACTGSAWRGRKLLRRSRVVMTGPIVKLEELTALLFKRE
jgi:hypothetical protein